MIHLFERNMELAYYRIASVEPVIVKDHDASLLESARQIAGVCQQPVHLNLEPAPKDVPRMIGSIIIWHS
jgi:hypothetical protein